jgi:hypothetical protein
VNGRGLRRVLYAVAALIVVFWLFAAPTDRSLSHFDPDRVAELEVGMWKAYYAKEKLTLFRLLVATLQEQYRFSRYRAVGVGFHWARAAAGFGDATGDYDRYLADLESGFQTIRYWTGAHFDPHAAAVAELSWWTARRKSYASPAQKNRAVADCMTDAYALLYELPRERVAEAARLRVEAADLRDRGAGPPGSDRNATVDWKAVSWLLHQSYRSLHAELQPR